MPNFYVSQKFTPDTKHVKVESGFGLCQNEANLDASRNGINVCDKLANAWTEPKQGMTKFPMNDDVMFNKHREINEPQVPGPMGSYPSDTNITARNRGDRGITPDWRKLGEAVDYSNNPD